MRHVLVVAMLMACNTDPGDPDIQVDYRDGLDGNATSGERGTVKVSEILWSGSVKGTGDDRSWDPDDVFIEFRNEGARAVNMSGWHIEISGSIVRTYRIPDTDFKLPVGGEAFLAAKSSGCFPEPTWVIPDLELPNGDPFRVTIRDRDERLMEPAGSRTQPPYAGGYDFMSSRSMERINLMFGGQGTEPQSWHYYNVRRCVFSDDDERNNTGLNCFDEPNNDKMLQECRRHTLASPGRPNSPDYSGAFASGGFE